jgi:AraC family transcriptional regulator of adaptative response/methylated-DNA-[protein]-cysteine methyltransferase
MAIRSNDLASFWRAVLRRDSRRDGEFVYAVRSTGVYCRPSCPARKPRSNQVEFFRTADEARRSGFRACRRCWVERGGTAEQVVLMARLCRALARQDTLVGRRETLFSFAAKAAVRPRRLSRLFERIVGVTPTAYADQIRLNRLKMNLRKEADVTTAMHESDYSSSSRLYERSDRQLGMTPSTYGRGGRGMEIHYTISPSPIGRILVAGTRRGVSAVYLGREDGELLAALHREYPEARIERDSQRVSRWVKLIVRHLAGRQARLELPLDIQGTAFQRRVWDALRQIPYGQTRSYTDVAGQLGQPKARRAVARACATNPVSLVIPCHRVIRSDGGLGGYGGGIQIKIALLGAEKRAAKSS